MLVMSRKQGESIELSELGVVVKVVGLKRSKVQLGVDAPPQITVNRSELADDRKKTAGGTEGHAGGDLSDQRLLEQLAHLERELAALAELADSKDRPLAQQIASESIQRVTGIRRTLRWSSGRSNEAKPIAEFVRVRSDVLNYLRDDPCEDADSEASCVRQSPADYAILPARTCVA